MGKRPEYATKCRNTENALPEQVAKKINASTSATAAQAPQPRGSCEGLPEPVKALSPVPRCISPRSQAVASPEARSEISGGPVHPCSACSILLAVKHLLNIRRQCTALWNQHLDVRSGCIASAGLSEVRQCHVMPVGAASDFSSISKVSGKRARRSARPSSWQRRRAARLLQVQTLHNASGTASHNLASRLARSCQRTDDLLSCQVR